MAGIFILLLSPSLLVGKNSLDDLVLLSCKVDGNIAQRLDDGYRGFIVQSNPPVRVILSEINLFLENNKDEIITLVVEQGGAIFLNELENSPAKQHLAIPEKYSFRDLNACKAGGKRLFVFAPEDSPLSFSAEKYICGYKVPAKFPEEIGSGFKGKPGNDLVVFDIGTVSSSLPDSLKNNPELVPGLFNLYTGKLPNFFVTGNKKVFGAYHRAFTKQTWVTANAVFGQKSLKGVNWQEMPLMTSFGKIHTTQLVLSPYKDGYHFSPDIFTFNDKTSENTKIFYARQKSLKEEMVLYLAFEQNTDNRIGKNNNISYSNVKYLKDKSRGWCSVFNGKDSYIDFDKDIVFHENFTVSAWVKPSKIDGNRSIIGKGKTLSIKFKDGRMLFTSPAIKDHIMDSALVVPNQWQHLTYVISNSHTVKFYKNGRLAETQKAERIEPTEYSLLIGTNLWDESFVGMMDDLIIWNRTLSDEEVKLLYERELEKNGGTNKKKYIGALALLAALSFSLLFYFMANKKRKRDLKRRNGLNKLSAQPNSPVKIKAPYINFFGGFKVVNRNEEELTTCFSPRRKQIFILVLIKTLKEKGISSKQLTDHLWAGYSAKSAKNNRSTQIQRIRETLALNSGANIAYSDKKWTISFDDDVYCDLADFFRLVKELKNIGTNDLNFGLLDKLIRIIEKGALLPNMDDEWLDGFKSRIADDLLDTLLPLYIVEGFTVHKEWVLRLSRALMIFDPLNETLLAHQINAQVGLGRNTQAHETLEHFGKTYLQCYGEPFNKSISNLLKTKDIFQ